MGWKLEVCANSARVLALPSMVNWYAAELTLKVVRSDSARPAGLYQTAEASLARATTAPASLNSYRPGKIRLRLLTARVCGTNQLLRPRGLESGHAAQEDHAPLPAANHRPSLVSDGPR